MKVLFVKFKANISLFQLFLKKTQSLTIFTFTLLVVLFAVIFTHTASSPYFVGKGNSTSLDILSVLSFTLVCLGRVQMCSKPFSAYQLAKINFILYVFWFDYIQFSVGKKVLVTLQVLYFPF